MRNVATLVTPPSKARHELRPLTVDEARAFLDSITGDRLAPLYTTAIATGMRQGELLALRWQEVDLDERTLTVRHTLRLGTRTLAAPRPNAPAGRSASARTWPQSCASIACDSLRNG